MKQSTFIIQFNDESKILLLKRPPTHPRWPNQWTLPGGKLDAGETVEYCAYREMSEETGIRMSVFEAVPVFLGGNSGIVYPFQSLVEFEGETLTKEFPNREHVEYGWFSGDDMPMEEMSEVALTLLEYQMSRLEENEY